MVMRALVLSALCVGCVEAAEPVDLGGPHAQALSCFGADAMTFVAEGGVFVVDEDGVVEPLVEADEPILAYVLEHDGVVYTTASGTHRQPLDECP